MEIVYCSSCGVRVSDSEMQSGAALHDAQGVYCARCAATRRPARQRTPSAPREVPPTTRANRVIPPSARAPGPKPVEARPAVAEKSSNAVWILTGAGAGLFGLALLVLTLSRPKPPPAQPTAAAAQQPVPTVAPAAGKPAATTPVSPESSPAPTKEPQPAAPPAAPSTSMGDVREDYAKRRWNELKGAVERGTLSGRGAQRQIKSFASLYASTAAGKEAVEYAKRLPTNEPPPPAPADVIAHYSRDFKPSQPGPGWRYLCNETDAIGAAAKYRGLVWNDTQKSYTANAQTYPANEPPGWVRLSADTSHPGRGAGQGVGFERYAIAAYTLDAAKSGKLAILGSLQRRAADGTIELRIYVNDTLKDSEKTDGGSTPIEFAVSLGTLNGGDTVYVAIGPDGQDGMDSCAVDFSIYTVR